MKGNQKSLGWCRLDELLRRLQLGLRREQQTATPWSESISSKPNSQTRAFRAKPSQSVTCPSLPFLIEGIIC